jgi:hypothetical protein
MNAFPDTLHFEDAGMRGSSRCFRLTEDFTYLSAVGAITVPSGFVTDGASIPKIFWSILSPFGDYFAAAVIHDYLYSNNNDKFSRLQADLIFKEAMFNLGVPWYRREVIFRAVHSFGGSSFKGNTIKPNTT